MSMASLETYRRRYALAGREWKARIMDEVCAMEGWTRKHAIKVLRRKVRRPCRPPAPLDSHPRLDYGTKQLEIRPTALPLTVPSVSWSFEATRRRRKACPIRLSPPAPAPRSPPACPS